MSSRSPEGSWWPIGKCRLNKDSKEWFRRMLPNFFKSLFEVTATLCFTFIPFFFLSIKWLAADGANTQSTILEAFFGYWQAGEIVLPILGLCGAVAALLALNIGYFPWWVHALVGVIVLGVTIGGGAALTSSGGFKHSLNSELITAGFFGYALLAFLWLILAVTVRTTQPKIRSSDSRANDILKRANDLRDGNESKL